MLKRLRRKRLKKIDGINAECHLRRKHHHPKHNILDKYLKANDNISIRMRFKINLPLFPSGPGIPDGPGSPCSPGGPGGPGSPGAPPGPCKPGAPGRPGSPASPGRPAGP